MTVTPHEIVVITTDREAFSATGQVFEKAYSIQLSQDQFDQLKKLENSGQSIIKLFLKFEIN